MTPAKQAIAMFNPSKFRSLSLSLDPSLQAIAYSMDALIPGFYLWCGAFRLRIGGSAAEKSYPGTIHSGIGIAIVLPGYQIYSTYRDSYDPR